MEEKLEKISLINLYGMVIVLSFSKKALFRGGLWNPKFAHFYLHQKKPNLEKNGLILMYTMHV